ncbi:MAG: hypothetical protein H6719_26680 [Sandaracinaceae bacterium]|nr:hypothetical protein [Sandaracinaceae bacterium]
MRASSGLFVAALLSCGGDPGVDAGPAPRSDAGVDAGSDAALDAGSTPGMCVRPAPVGTIGGLCGAGGACGGPAMCLTGSPLTLGDLGYMVGTPDPAHPGELLAGGPSPIPVLVAPDGLCTTSCRSDEGDVGCDPCATCRSEVGGSERLQRLGLTAGWLASATPPDADGVCRARCTFDADTTGGCPDGYTCDRWASACVERCVSDAQCRVELGVSSSGGTVAYEVGDAVCDAVTGRCRWTPPLGAAHGTACERDEDCPRDVGTCVVGRCATAYCERDAYACPASARCLELEGSPGICATTCATIDDCPARRVCVEVEDGGSNVCSPVCDAAHPCRSDERCFPVFADPSLGACLPFCDASGAGTAGAVACDTDEVCRPVEGRDFGACQAADAYCYDAVDCGPGQTCERLVDTDAYGRCMTP